MMDDKRFRSYIRLHLAGGVGPVLWRRLVEAFGDVEGVFAASMGQWQRVDGIGEKTAAAMAAVTDAEIDSEIAEAARAGVRIITCEDEDYPAPLKTIYDYPSMLYVAGALTATDALAVAVVGSRRCTHYGMEQAGRFGGLLGRAGFTVVSGGARGIDTASHRGALEVGGRTVAVMGCGLSQTYPPENKQLFEQIVESGRGALISELPMRTSVMGGNFPTRNRIISGLSLGVLVIEAALRSGSLITAREAAQQGREVFALPGRVDSPFSQGTNKLIRDGSILVQDLEDILEHLGKVGKMMNPPEAAPAPLPLAGLTDGEQKLLAALAGGELSLDDLVRNTGLSTGQTASAMTMLVIKGAVAQRPGNIFAVKKY
jgi:DNA processing protein